MSRTDFLRSTPFRLAFASITMVAATFLIAAIIVYSSARKDFAEIHDNRLAEIFRILSANDEQDLAEAVNARINASTGDESVLLLEKPGGAIVAGNIPSIRTKPGLSDIAADELGIDQDYSYRLMEGPIGPYRLVVGISNIELEELREVLMSGFGWALLVAGALTTAGAFALASRARQRLEAFKIPLRQVSDGNLQARIPLVGNNDDIDRISGEINDALTHLAIAVEGLRQVSTDIAHDLKTPLSRLKYQIETAARKNQNGETVAGNLNAALLETERIDETFSALLRIAQIESGARKSQFKPLALDALLENLADIYAGVAEDAGMELVPVRRAGTGMAVQGDKELLTQLFANLIENAIRHCPAGARIECSIESQADRLRVDITDNGPGIPETERPKALRRLYRLEKSRTSSGTGLGLSLVKAIADLHDAELVLGNNDPGLRVSLLFPRIHLTKTVS